MASVSISKKRAGVCAGVSGKSDEPACPSPGIEAAGAHHGVGERASIRFLEFFAANIRNPHTRRAYSRAVTDFLNWCGNACIASIAGMQPLHVATWIETLTRRDGLAAPTVTQRLAARP